METIEKRWSGRRDISQEVSEKYKKVEWRMMEEGGEKRARKRHERKKMKSEFINQSVLKENLPP